MSGGLTPPVVSFLVRNPSVSCVKPQLACHRLSHSLQAVQLKSKFAAFYEYFTSRLQGKKKKVDAVSLWYFTSWRGKAS